MVFGFNVRKQMETEATNQTTGISTATSRNATRIAGLAYILVILMGLLKVNFIDPATTPFGNSDLEARISANELLFRIGITCEIVMYLLVIVLAVALYMILKPVNKNLAASALYFRFGEAIIGTASVILSGLVPLLLINKGQSPDDYPVQSLIELFVNTRISALHIVLIFVGVGGTIYCYLFYISRMVPRVLAAWGIGTYISMFLLGFLNILFPGYADKLEGILFATGALFEVLFGLWLLFKGVRLVGKNHTPA